MLSACVIVCTGTSAPKQKFHVWGIQPWTWVLHDGMLLEKQNHLQTIYPYRRNGVSELYAWINACPKSTFTLSLYKKKKSVVFKFNLKNKWCVMKLHQMHATVYHCTGNGTTVPVLQWEFTALLTLSRSFQGGVQQHRKCKFALTIGRHHTF